MKCHVDQKQEKNRNMTAEPNLVKPKNEDMGFRVPRRDYIGSEKFKYQRIKYHSPIVSNVGSGNWASVPCMYVRGCTNGTGTACYASACCAT